MTINFTKDIHFPVNQALYKKPPKRSWWKKIFKFMTYRRQFKTYTDYVLYIPTLDKFTFVPAGFKYDNASVPKLLNSLYNSDGMLLLGSVVHDFGYRYEGLLFINQDTRDLTFKRYTKKELDTLFQYLCSYESGFEKASWLAAKGLGLFGFLGWNENRKKNNNLTDDFPHLWDTSKN